MSSIHFACRYVLLLLTVAISVLLSTVFLSNIFIVNSCLPTFQKYKTKNEHCAKVVAAISFKLNAVWAHNIIALLATCRLITDLNGMKMLKRDEREKKTDKRNEMQLAFQ